MRKTPEEVSEETPEEIILNRIREACGHHIDCADCRRCIKIALHAVKNTLDVRSPTAVAQHNLDKRALKGLEMIARAVQAGAYSPIPGFNRQQLKGCIKPYRAWREIGSIKQRENKRSDHRKATAVRWASNLLERYKIPTSVTEGGTWHLTARDLYGSDHPSANQSPPGKGQKHKTKKREADLYHVIRTYHPSQFVRMLRVGELLDEVVEPAAHDCDPFDPRAIDLLIS